MTILKSVMMAILLLAGGSSLAIAQNGLATGDEHPVAGGAAGSGWGWFGGAPYSYGNYPRLYDYYRLHERRVVPTVPPNH